MNRHITLFLLTAGAAASTFAGEVQSQLVDGRLIPPSQVGQISHVYINLGTGEKIVSQVVDGQTIATDTRSSELIWSVNSLFHQCEGINGYTGISPIGFGDDIDGTNPWDVGGTWRSMGDIATDTVVDCVGFNYWSSHEDSDTNADGVGDGVPGFGIVLDWWDADNGISDDSNYRVPLIQLVFGTLPGALDNEPGFFDGHIFTIDLTAANLGESFVMEIGDSDGNLQGAAIGNSDGGNGWPIGESGHDVDGDGVDDADLDGDGLFDWSFGMRFIQPGTYDFDDDGLLDGDIADQADVAIGMGAPAGHTPVSDSSGNWRWQIDLDAPSVATGAEQYAAIFLPPDPITGEIVHSGFLSNFAGFTDGVPNSFSCEFDAFVPAATIAHDLYSPENPICEPMDIDCSGTLDFFDVSLFLENFANGDDYNNDGVTDFFDVSAFLSDFGAGLP